jgi:hypothetical protein
MSVGETMGFDVNAFAGRALDWKSSAVDSRQYRIDHGAHPALGEIPGSIRGRRGCGRWRPLRGLSGGPCAPAPLLNHEVPSAE